jgi:uncharacterized protein (DUF2141 family)
MLHTVLIDQRSKDGYTLTTEYNWKHSWAGQYLGWKNRFEGGRLVRKASVYTFLVLLIVTIAVPAYAQGTEIGTIAVRLDDVDETLGGDLIIVLYRSESGWLEMEKAFQVSTTPAVARSIDHTLTDIPYGSSYALYVFHDENGNGELDVGKIIPKPTEGVGVSNNAVRLGPPLYSKAKFALDQASILIAIKMRY